MKRRSRTVWGWALLVGLALVGLIFAVPDQEANASALSARPSGWLAARRYLEEQGARVTLSDRPLGKAPVAGEGEASPVWVLTFPWQGGLRGEEVEALQDHLRGGGTLVVGYSKTLQQYQELSVLAELGIELRTVRSPPPLVPWEWWAYQRETWSLEPGDGWGDAARDVPNLSLPATQTVPDAPPDAAVLYTYRSGEIPHPLVFSTSLQRGLLVVLPAALLSNAFLLEEGHADFLESLHQWLGGTWSFDEYHHGLVSAEFAAKEGSTFAWDLFMIHVGLFYVLGLLAVMRRFGPPWREAGVVTGSTSSFLRNLGALHRELGHHQAAARLLAERRRELDPSYPATAVPEVADDARLVAFARGTLTHEEKHPQEKD